MKQTTLNWYLIEKERPPRVDNYLVFGTIIEQGRMVKDFRICHWEGSKGFFLCADMSIEFWANLPRPI